MFDETEIIQGKIDFLENEIDILLNSILIIQNTKSYAKNEESIIILEIEEDYLNSRLEVYNLIIEDYYNILSTNLKNDFLFPIIIY